MFSAALLRLRNMARREKKTKHRSCFGIIGEPQRHGILAERICQFIDTAFHGEARRVLERRAHIAGRLHVGADKALHAAEIRKSIKTRAGRRVFPWKQIMPRGLCIDLVDGADDLTGPICAKPNMMPAGGAETRIMEY